MVKCASASSYQHVSVLDVEVEEEEEGDEEAEEGDGGAFPQTPHLIQGFPHQPHAARALSGTCGRTTTGEVRRWSDLLPVVVSAPLHGSHLDFFYCCCASTDFWEAIIFH